MQEIRIKRSLGRQWPNSLRRRLLAGGLSTAAALVAFAGCAQAQTATNSLADQYFAQGIPGYGAAPGVTVLSRARPDYDPLGIRSGDFIIRPELDESLGYNTNLLGVGSAKGSLQEDTAGSLRVNSDWGRNSIGGEVTFDDRRTPSLPSQDRTDWTASLGGTYEIGRDVLTVAASHLSLYQDPTTIDAQQFNQTGVFYTAPIPFTMNDVRASYATTLGRFVITPNVDYTQFRFSNLKLISLNGATIPAAVNGAVLGVPIDQRYRDRDVIETGGTARYDFAPLQSGLLVFRNVDTTYISSQANAFGPSRSSTAIEVLTGLDYVASGVWRYRALVGYEIRQFHNSAYKQHSAPIAEANLIWQPTGLTTVTARVARTIEDAADESVSGFVYTTGRLQVDHEYARNILLTGYLGLQRADYLQSPNSETFYGGGVGATWLLDRNVHLAATYDLSQREASKNFGPNFNTSVGLLTLKLGL